MRLNPRPPREKNDAMQVQIFDVEHGACALVTADTGARILIDCGHNSSSNWRPSHHLPAAGISTIEMFVVTNKDNDHVSDLPNLRRAIHLKSLLRNTSISSQALATMKPDGIPTAIQSLMSMIDTYTGPSPQVDWGDLSYKFFYNSHGTHFTDTNNLSLVLFLHYHGLHIVFPGDLEKEGWQQLLQRSDFVEEIKKVNVFVASHHGRESGCCEELFELGWQPQIVVMSDKGIQYETQATVGWYATRSIGMDYNGEPRSVFTTRKDGRILINATPQSVTISTTREEQRTFGRALGA